MLNPQAQAHRYERFRAACKPRTRFLIADCDLCIINDTLRLTIPPDRHPYPIAKLYASLGNAAAKQGLGLTIVDMMFNRQMYVS